MDQIVHSAPLDALKALLGAEHVTTVTDELAFYSTDVYRRADVDAALVLSPGTIDELAAAIGICTRHNIPVIPRGGGLSYTGGFLPTQTGSAMIDMRRLDRIIEINAEDMYVTVECGATWKSLYEKLKPLGLRTPYFGPMSGYASSVGGALSQGSIFLGGFDAGTGGAGGASVTKNHTTSGVVTDGAIVENEIPTSVFSKGVLEIELRQGDFTSAVRMANAINEQIAPIAEAVSPTTVQVFVPREMQAPEKQMEFVARIENATFVPDVPARIVINERTGTLVANANIQISKVAVAYGSLTVSIASTQAVSQPNSFTGNNDVTNSGNSLGNITGNVTGNVANDNGGRGAGRTGGRGRDERTAGNGNRGDGRDGGDANQGIHTQVTNNTTTNVQEEKRAIIVLKDMPTVEDVAFALNSMGATPRELMSILQSIKDAWALNAELVLE